MSLHEYILQSLKNCNMVTNLKVTGLEVWTEFGTEFRQRNGIGPESPVAYSKILANQLLEIYGPAVSVGQADSPAHAAVQVNIMDMPEFIAFTKSVEAERANNRKNHILALRLAPDGKSVEFDFSGRPTETLDMDGAMQRILEWIAAASERVRRDDYVEILTGKKSKRPKLAVYESDNDRYERFELHIEGEPTRLSGPITIRQYLAEWLNKTAVSDGERKKLAETLFPAEKYELIVKAVPRGDRPEGYDYYSVVGPGTGLISTADDIVEEVVIWTSSKTKVAGSNLRKLAREIDPTIYDDESLELLVTQDEDGVFHFESRQSTDEGTQEHILETVAAWISDQTEPVPTEFRSLLASYIDWTLPNASKDRQTPPEAHNRTVATLEYDEANRRFLLSGEIGALTFETSERNFNLAQGEAAATFVRHLTDWLDRQTLDQYYGDAIVNNWSTARTEAEDKQNGLTANRPGGHMALGIISLPTGAYSLRKLSTGRLKPVDAAADDYPTFEAAADKLIEHLVEFYPATVREKLNNRLK